MYSSDNQCTAALKASRASGARKGTSIPNAHQQGCGPSPALRVGGAAGAAAGFAVVPVAAQVHFDGQSAVGSCLVLAAVVCKGEKKKWVWKE